MNFYDMVMKGPPRWLVRATIMLIILVVGVQIGMYQGRSKESDKAIAQVIATKDRQIELLKDKLYAAQKDARQYRMLVNIIDCESGVKHENVWGDGGKSYGIAQFQYKTFNWMREKACLPKLRWKNKHDQITLLSWALENGYEKYWSCYKKVKENNAE